MKVKSTSRLAHDSIKPAKQAYWDKIIDGLKKLKVGGTFSEISMCIGVSPDHVWKRLSELERDGKIYNTGMTRKLPSGRAGSVWQLTSYPIVNPENPTTDTEVKDLKRAGIPIKENILVTQQQLFQ